ncbi:hypothetical protein BX070DRAFT_147555 [Coemansia spiralis]|nr:hypothetical protein BX070DRAFT_147555 [Coemansia spiralis]
MCVPNKKFAGLKILRARRGSVGLRCKGSVVCGSVASCLCRLACHLRWLAGWLLCLSLRQASALGCSALGCSALGRIV